MSFLILNFPDAGIPATADIQVFMEDFNVFSRLVALKKVIHTFPWKSFYHLGGIHHIFTVSKVKRNPLTLKVKYFTPFFLAMFNRALSWLQNTISLGNRLKESYFELQQ